MPPPVRSIGESNESYSQRLRDYNDKYRENPGGNPNPGGGTYMPVPSRPVPPALRIAFAVVLWVAIIVGFWKLPLLTAFQPFSGLLALAVILIAVGHTFPNARWYAWIALAPLALVLTVALTLTHAVSVGGSSSWSSPTVSQKQHKLLHHHHKPS